MSAERNMVVGFGAMVGGYGSELCALRRRQVVRSLSDVEAARLATADLECHCLLRLELVSSRGVILVYMHTVLTKWGNIL